MSRMAMIYGFTLIVGLIGVTYTYWSDYRHRRQQHRHP